jgi:RNA polymerase primary sigma factor
MKQLQITPSITTRDIQSVEVYFNEIGKEGLITAEDEVMLAQKIKQGDQAALAKLVLANLRFVVSIAKKYQYQGLPLSDLISEGNVGLLKAALKFDDTKGFKFISFAVWWIRESIMTSIANNTRIIRLPMNKIGDISKIKKAVAAVEQQTLREPTAEQIAKHLGMTACQVNDTLYFSHKASSYDAPIDDEDFCLLDCTPANDAEADRPLMEESLRMEMEFLLSKLTDRERTVIELSFGIIDGMELTPGDISQNIGMSTESVRKIRKDAIAKLQYWAKQIADSNPELNETAKNA